jgi:hypothetical protein
MSADCPVGRAAESVSGTLQQHPGNGFMGIRFARAGRKLEHFRGIERVREMDGRVAFGGR